MSQPLFHAPNGMISHCNLPNQQIPPRPLPVTRLSLDLSYPSDGGLLGLAFSQPYNPKSMSQNNSFTNGLNVEDDGSEYTITTQGPNEVQPSQDACSAAFWSNIYSNQSIQATFSPWVLPPYHVGVPGETLASPSVLNLNRYPQNPPIINTFTLYDGVVGNVQMSPTNTENSLSPLFATSSSMSPPSTPSSTYNGSFSHSPVSSTELYLAPVDHGDVKPANGDKKQYTHREQLVLFREVFKLPMDGAGPFVPQQMYKPHTTSDRKRYVEDILLEPPVFFYSDSPTRCGIPLRDALHSRTKKLLNRDSVVFEGRGPSVSIRLEWPGYRQWSRQIPTKDFRNPPGPITLAKLAKNVAKCVQRFMQDRRSTPMEEDADHRWRIGDGPNDIKLEDLVLVSMHHVSLGSWQPQLRLVRPREKGLDRPSITANATPLPAAISGPSIPLPYPRNLQADANSTQV